MSSNNVITKEGIFNLLAVRVSDDTTGFLSVEQSEEKLANDIFEDENNVVSVFLSVTFSLFISSNNLIPLVM